MMYGKETVGGLGGYAKYIPIAALAFCLCSQAPENCGDGQKLDAHNEFCFEGKAYKKCGGEAYDPVAQFCSAENSVLDKCNGYAFDYIREFCHGGKVFAKCGGGDEYSPDTQGCVFGIILSKCGNNFYDAAGQFCHNGKTVYAKCNGGVFDPAAPGANCAGAAAQPKCGTESYNAETQFCDNNKVYAKCDGSDYVPAQGCNGAKERPLCNGAGFDDSLRFCYNGAVYPKCGGQDYNPSLKTCHGAELADTVIMYRVTVSSVGTDASSGGAYAAGKAVTIRAGAAPVGQQFINWTAPAESNVAFAKADTAVTTFIMPGNDVTVTANFGNTYQVTVSSVGTGAKGGGRYVAGATVSISPGTAPSGLRFHSWTTVSGGVTPANANSASTTFTMPASAVTVKAVFAVVDSRDQAIYKVTTIGNQTWMAQNLNYLPKSGKFWCFQDKETNCDKFGRLYDWSTAMAGSRWSDYNPSEVPGYCPSGWHVPSVPEWKDLINTVGSSAAGTKLKAKSPDWNGTDDYGFTALIGGARNADGEYYNSGSWWTTESINTRGADVMFLRSDSTRLLSTSVARENGHAVRCVKD
jgi:uncharacterized protein (TIGR02145 family)